MKKYLESILTNEEINALGLFNANPTMVSAVKKSLLASLYSQGTLQESADPNPLYNACISLVANKDTKPNEQVGAELRAMWEGLNFLERGMTSIGEFKSEASPTEKKEKNPAR